MRRSATALLTLGAILALGGAALAAKRIDSKVTIHVRQGQGLVWYGKVKSDNDKCVPDRKVKLYVKQQGGSFYRVDTDQTDEDGKWNIHTVIPGGVQKGYAKVKKERIGRPGYRKLCEPDRSRKIPAP